MNFLIDLHIYPFDIVVSIGDTNEELKKVLLKLGINEADVLRDINYGQDRADAINNLYYSKYGLIRMFKKGRDAYWKALLSHEISDLVFSIMKRIGMKHKRSSREAYSYLTQYLTFEIYKKLK